MGSKHDRSSAAMSRLRGEMERAPFNRWLGVRALDVTEDGAVDIGLRFRPELGYHPTESIFHGGIIASLIDVAGYAALAIRSDGPTPTVTLTVDYLAPAMADELLAKAQVRRLGRSLSRVDIDVLAGARLVAIGRGVFSTREPA